MQLNKIPSDTARVMSVSAHPDDSEVYAGGSIAQFAAAGAEVTLVLCTDGARGGRGVTDIASVRNKEQDHAAAVLGVKNVEKLGYRDGDLKPSDELRDKLIELIRRYRPDVVLGHHPQTIFTRYGDRVQMGHSDHRASGTSLLDAIYPRSASPHFLPGIGEPWFPREVWLFDCAEPDYCVDIADGFARKIEAVKAHDSQQGAGGGLVKATHRLAATFGSEEQPAEGFVRLRLRR